MSKIFTSFIYNVDSYLPQIQKRISPFNCANKPDKIDYISGKPLLLSPASMYRNYNYGNFNRNFFSGYKNKNYYDDYVNFHDKYNFGL